MNPSYDCIVMGGGPAGSTLGALVAEAGHKTLLVEREKFPRFHVGESLMPATYEVFQRLGVLEQMKSSQFVKKMSVQFVSHTGKETEPFDFRRHDPHERSQTWQVERSTFDQMLWDNAAKKGVTCCDQTRVLEVLFEDQRACGIRAQTASGRVQTIAAQVVVDATGQQSLLANSLGLKQVTPNLRKAAIWGYYQGARREPGEHGGATIVMHTTGKDAWFWSIPLSNGVTSVGLVGDNDDLLKGRGSPDTVFQQEMVKCPSVTKRLTDAQLVSPFRVAREFSYSTSRAAGDGWVLVGDAWGFIDPIYSSGIFFALKSSEMAADHVIEGIQTGDTSANSLGGWSDEFTAATQWIRKLVGAFYTKSFSFGHFLDEYPQHRGNLTDLLIGRIFKPDVGKIFEDLDPWLTEATKSEKQV